MSETATIKKSAEASLCCDVYRNAKMGAEAILNLLPSVEDESLKSELTSQLTKYEEFAADAEELLEKRGESPLEESGFSRMMAKMGIKMNTLIDKTSSHVAQMVIEGATMGMTDMTTAIREHENKGCSESALKLARDIAEFEDKSVDKLKKFL